MPMLLKRKKQLQNALAENELGINQDDIDELNDVIEDMKSDEAIYDLAIVSALATVATKTTALTSQTAAAATNSGTAGFTGGITLDINGNQQTTNTSSTRAVASNLSSQNLQIQTGKEGTRI